MDEKAKLVIKNPDSFIHAKNIDALLIYNGEMFDIVDHGENYSVISPCGCDYPVFKVFNGWLQHKKQPKTCTEEFIDLARESSLDFERADFRIAKKWFTNGWCACLENEKLKRELEQDD